MKIAKKFLFAVSVFAALTMNGVASAQSFYQGTKPPEKVKEKEKDRQPPPKSDKDKDRGGGRDDKKGDDKKKKPDFFN